MTDEIGKRNARNLNNRMMAVVRGKVGRPDVYTEEEKAWVLGRLEVHKFNYKKTAEITGIDYKTIKVWFNQRAMAVIEAEKKTELAETTKNMTIEQMREKYERDVINAKTAILQQIVDNMSQCKANRTLLSTLKVINESTQTPGAPAASSAKPAPAEGGSVLKMIAQQANVNINNNGPENNRAGGDSKEPAG